MEKSMKRICILSSANIRHMTLINLYTDILKKRGYKYDIIYADRYGEEEYTGANNTYRCEVLINKKWSFIKKLLCFRKFLKYGKKVLNQNKYDFIIVWNELTIFLFGHYLRKKYSKKYCINIRDWNYNNVFIVQRNLTKSLEKCAFATISSPKFIDFLPKYDYLFIHSSNESIVQNVKSVNSMKKINDIIKIVFVGRLSYPDTMKRFILSLKNDKRFSILAAGQGCEELSDFITTNEVQNVRIVGAFNPEKTSEFINEADIIYSLNKEGEFFSDVLLPIKLYYSIKRRVPIIAYKTSFTFQYASNCGLGIGITDNDFSNIGDVIFDKYHSMKFDEISNRCEFLENDIRNSHIALENKVLKELGE